jgi:hypothetical protein
MLNDDELIELLGETYLKISPHFDTILSLIEQFTKFAPDEEIDLEAIMKTLGFEEVRTAFREADKIITRIKARLNILAETVP